jgi:hypothetical protein
MTPRWRDNRLDLGPLGEVRVYEGYAGFYKNWCWAWMVDQGEVDYQFATATGYPTAAAAQRDAETWIRRALKRAARRVG